jgi:hypothetical protein
MSQISPPIRILLVAVIGLCAAYMLFLKPKDEAVPAAPPAASTPVPAKDPNAQTQSKPGAAVQQAVRGADNASARADAAAGGAIADTEGGPTASPATGVNTNPVAEAPATGETSAPTNVSPQALKTLPKDVRKAIKQRKVLAILFYNNRSYDDKAVRRELDKVSHYGHQVFVDAHWIKSVGRYQAITRGVSVDQSPTIVVADANLKAETLVGYVDHETIDQAIVDAIRASGGSLIKNPYFRKLDAICTSVEQQAKGIATPASAAAVPAFLDGLHGIMVDADKKVAAVKPGKAHVRFHKRFKVYTEQSRVLVGAMAGYARSNPAKGLQALKSLDAEGKKLDKKFVAKNGAHGLSCF